MNNSVIRCCHNCPDRFIKEIDGKIIRCHSSCKKYIEAKEKFEKIREEERKEVEFTFLSLSKRRRKL